MSTSHLVATFLPGALALIMFSLGLTLTSGDFARIFKTPKPILTGLSVQLILLPALAMLLIAIFGLEPELAVGLMLLAASPGGVTANLFSHLAGGDVALNITLTALNSVIAAFSVPLIVHFSLSYYLSQDQQIGLQLGKMIEVFLIVLVPVFIGMVLRAKNHRLTQRLEKPLHVFSIFFLVLVVVITIAKEHQVLAESFGKIGLLILFFNLSSLAIGFFSGRWMKLDLRQSIGIGFEIGIHNVTLALFIAYSVLENTRLALPAAVYGVVMYVTGGAVVALLKKKRF